MKDLFDEAKSLAIEIRNELTLEESINRLYARLYAMQSSTANNGYIDPVFGYVDSKDKSE